MSISDRHALEAQARAVDAPDMAGLDLAQEVSAAHAYAWTQTEWALGSGYGKADAERWHVVAFDFGVKRNILRMLVGRGCRVTVVPAQHQCGRGAGAAARRHLPVQRPG